MKLDGERTLLPVMHCVLVCVARVLPHHLMCFSLSVKGWWGGVMWGGRGSPSHGGVGGLVWASWSAVLGGRMRCAKDGDVWTLPHNELVQDINL